MADTCVFDRDQLATTLRRLAGHSVFLGTSSGKYPGWFGVVSGAIPPASSPPARQALKPG